MIFLVLSLLILIQSISASLFETEFSFRIFTLLEMDLCTYVSSPPPLFFLSVDWQFSVLFVDTVVQNF